MKIVGYILAAAVVALDQPVKYWIVHVIDLQRVGTVPVTSFLSLEWVANFGVSWSLLQGSTGTMRWLLVAGTGAIAALVAVWMTRERTRADVIALGLVLGGALGNIVDRVRLGFVVDFLHLHTSWFDFGYVFNVADTAISVGVMMLLMRGLFVRPNAVAA